MPVPVTGMVAR
uniref:Uncharacterized protein n=1 Tax=Rhizophora mucronata TaxID=61149 RepID=A0A2P2NR46_RHIMU